jgi:hypothetical protein
MLDRLIWLLGERDSMRGGRSDLVTTTVARLLALLENAVETVINSAVDRIIAAWIEESE